MRNLNPISNNLINWYIDIVSNKDNGDIKDELNSILNDITIRYQEYESNFSSKKFINIADSLFTKNHPGLISCYKSEGNTLKLLKKKIIDNQSNDLKGICQYCGVLKPKTFDHYLPISFYPEFSSLALNLIPCCKDCNGKKHNYWKENNDRGIFNFYLDIIPAIQFLFGKIVFISNVPHIEYEIKNPNNSINSFIFDIIKKHYTRLELIELYKEESSDELGEIIRMFEIYLEKPTIKSLKEKLIIDAQQLQAQFGINYWKGILRITLADSNQFLAYIIDLINGKI